LPRGPLFFHLPPVVRLSYLPPMHRLLTLFLLVAASLSVPAADFDLVIRDGWIVDGKGGQRLQGDLAIKDGEVVGLGTFEGVGKTELLAEGLVVAPGFIDVHTHAEGMENNPGATNFVRMGVTTLVLGNCGSSRTDLGAYYKKLEKVGFAPNVCSLIGQGSVRSQVMGGSFMRPPTSKEMKRMEDLVEKAMNDGAVGMSTGLIYLPGSFTSTEELVKLASVVSKHGGVYASHIRNEGDGIFKALEELINIAREADVPAEVSHIKLAGKNNWGQTDKVLNLLDEARAEGLRITHDQYMYPASSTGIHNRIPNWAREGGRKEFLKRVRDPETKAKIIAEMKERLEKSGHAEFDYAMIAFYGKDKSLNGLSVADATERTKGTRSIEAQIEMILEIYEQGGASGVFHSMSEDDLRQYLQHPSTMIAADSGVREYGNGVPHPRGYGNNARALARYVREQELLPLEEMIRKMTSLPATTFGLKGRGVLEKGSAADVVVFDPDKVQDRATFTDPHHYATGFRWVLVNGVPVVENDVHTGAKAGRIVKRER